jgi:hypothetical protein
MEDQLVKIARWARVVGACTVGAVLVLGVGAAAQRATGIPNKPDRTFSQDDPVAGSSKMTVEEGWAVTRHIRNERNLKDDSIICEKADGTVVLIVVEKVDPTAETTLPGDVTCVRTEK